MTTHSSVLAWRIPGTGEPAGLPSMGSHRVGHDRSDLAAAAAAASIVSGDVKVQQLCGTVWQLLRYLSIELGTVLFVSSMTAQLHSWVDA